jgi:hypothetical protein
MAKVLQAAVALLLVEALLLLAHCDGRELKASGAAASGGAAANGGGSSGGDEKATGLPLIPPLPPVLGPVVPLPPVVSGIPPARESDRSPWVREHGMGAARGGSCSWAEQVAARSPVRVFVMYLFCCVGTWSIQKYHSHFLNETTFLSLFTKLHAYSKPSNYFFCGFLFFSNWILSGPGPLAISLVSEDLSLPISMSWEKGRATALDDANASPSNITLTQYRVQPSTIKHYNIVN